MVAMPSNQFVRKAVFQIQVKATEFREPFPVTCGGRIRMHAANLASLKMSHEALPNFLCSSFNDFLLGLVGVGGFGAISAHAVMAVQEMADGVFRKLPRVPMPCIASGGSLRHC